MKIEFDFENEFSNTPVPNFFIENYMCKENAIYCVIYIYLYKKYCEKDCNISLDSLAKKFGMNELEIKNCLDYWMEKKLIEYGNRNNNLCLKFIFFGFNEGEKEKNISDNLNYIGFGKKNFAARSLFNFAQDMLGKYLDYNETRILLGLHNDFKLPFEVIKFLISYCVKNGKKNINYIEKVGISWADEKIFDLKTAKNKVDDVNNFFCEIKNALAINKLNSEQRKMILYWHNNLGMEKSLIIEACNMTMMKIGIPNFNYIEKIILNWDKNGIRKLEDAKKFVSEKKNKNDSERKMFCVNRKRKGLPSFEYKKWNFDDLKKIIEKTGEDDEDEQ